MVLMVLIGVCVVRVASVLKAVYIAVQTNVAPYALRTSTIISKYMAAFAIDQLALNVSITAWHLRCDKYVVFLRNRCAS